MLIQELTKQECVDILMRLRFGRLGCSRDNQPYIVPIYFAYDDRHLYTFAIVGQKIEWMRANPLVCVQADEIVDRYHWTSVIVQGHYEELLDSRQGNPERTRAHELLREWDPEYTRAYELLRERAMWWEPASVAPPHPVAGEKAVPIYYRIHIDQVTGRRASPDPDRSSRGMSSS